MNGDHTGPMNLGNPDEFTIRQLAELVRDRIDPELPLIEKPLPQDDPRQRRPSIDLARQQLGWQPTVSLEQGLEPTIDSFRKVLEIGWIRESVTVQRICCIGAGYVGRPDDGGDRRPLPGNPGDGGGHQPGANRCLE